MAEFTLRQDGGKLAGAFMHALSKDDRPERERVLILIGRMHPDVHTEK